MAKKRTKLQTIVDKKLDNPAPPPQKKKRSNNTNLQNTGGMIGSICCICGTLSYACQKFDESREK